MWYGRAMIETRLLARGPFTDEQVKVTAVAHSNQATMPEIEAHIDVAWDALVKDAEAKGKRIWNGITARANSVSVEDGVLRLELAPLDFKHRECGITYPGYYELPESYWRKGLYAVALVETRDGFFVFVKLSGKSMNKNTEEMLGGIVGDEGPVESGTDLFNELYRELEEEGSIPKSSVAHMALELVYVAPRTNVGLHFSVLLHDTRKEVQERFDKADKDHDVHSLIFVTRAELPQKLIDLGGYKPFVARELGFV